MVETKRGFATSHRTHTCGELTASDIGGKVKLAGWAHNVRNHGQLIFIDLRDRFGLVQCIIDSSNAQFTAAENIGIEDVLQIFGSVVLRTEQTRNAQIATGDIEIYIERFAVINESATPPFAVNSEEETAEEMRLRFRYLDMRRQRLRDNLILRAQMINAFRTKLTARGFLEMQTPILTAVSPEGARDFLVPSRLYPGKMFALPQSPQQFKQLLMIGGFDRYFQIAPCFRDEAARADRSPGEHYQVDIEMSFVDQDDVFAELEPILFDVFSTLGNGRPVSPYPFRRIEHRDALLKYGTDKPDLRNPLEIAEVGEVFRRDDVTFSQFKDAVSMGAVVRAIAAPDCATRPRSWFDALTAWAKSEGGKGLAYIVLTPEGGTKGPIAKFFSPEAMDLLIARSGAGPGSAIFMICGERDEAAKLAGRTRTKLAEDLGLIVSDAFEFCWITDFPMYEINEESGKIDFAHNPFSMPRGGLESLKTLNPLEVVAQQYDIVCNGYELCSGAVRNHVPEIMLRAFELAGYDEQSVEDKFGGLLTALRFGAPPHAGCAPGVDRMVMLLSGEKNLRQVIAFPMNQKQQDLLMQAPNTVEPDRLKELGIAFRPTKAMPN